MIGLDPEFNIKNVETGESLSAHIVWPEKRQYFFNVGQTEPSLEEGEMLGSETERDGAAVEIRNLCPTDCRDNFIPYFGAALRDLQLHVEANHPGYTVAADPKYVLEPLPEDTPKDVSDAGCRPDWDAYSMSEKVASCVGNLRYTGGHIHYGDTYGQLGWGLEKFSATAVAMDYVMGLGLVAALGETHGDGEAHRRHTYGMAGSFRHSDRKIEYRVPSSRAFLSPVLLSWITGLMRSMQWKSWSKEALQDRFFSILGPVGIQAIINDHDVEGARKFYPDIMAAIPGYEVDPGCLEYRLSGGGGSTYNPFFFKVALDVMVHADNHGVHWSDSLKENWGLFEDYHPEHHQYWGIHGAIAGQMDDLIFPQTPFIKEIVPGWEPSHGEPVYTHPRNGGKKKYMQAHAYGWLQ